MRTITERIAKRIQRGQRWEKSAVSDAMIVKWAKEYAAAQQESVRNLGNISTKLLQSTNNGQ